MFTTMRLRSAQKISEYNLLDYQSVDEAGDTWHR